MKLSNFCLSTSMLYPGSLNRDALPGYNFSIWLFEKIPSFKILMLHRFQFVITYNENDETSSVHYFQLHL